MLLGPKNQLTSEPHGLGGAGAPRRQEQAALPSTRALSRHAASCRFSYPLGPAPHPDRPADLSADHRRLLGPARRP